MKLLVLLTLLSLFALGPLLAPGYFWGAHDARHSVYFLFEFNRAISDGIPYPRWMPDFSFGFGYPFFNIYGPLSFYVGAVFLKMGLDFVTATKMVFGLAILSSGWAMFGFVRGWLNDRAGLVAALVYVYAPYHLLDVYVRGALAETVALVFLPLCLWSFGAAIERPRGAAVIGAAISYAGLMLAHNGVALLFSPVLAIYMVALVLVKIHRNQPLHQLTWSSFFPLIGHLIHVGFAPLLALILGLGLSAVFWLPALLEFKFVRTDQWTAGVQGYYDYHFHFTYFFQLFSPHWGFAPSQPGPHDDLSLQLGAAASVLALCSIFVVTRCTRRRDTLIFFQVATLVLIFLMLPPSATLWEKLQLVSFAQFPWRLLMLTALTMAPLAGAVLIEACPHPQPLPRGRGEGLARGRALDLPALLLCLLVLFSSYPYVTAQIIEPTEGPVSFAGLMKFEHNAGELTGSTIWVQTIPTWGPLAEVYLTNQAPTSQVDYANLPPTVVVDSRGHSSIHDELWFRAEQDSRITFNRFFYPGWHAYLLDREHGRPTQTLDIEPQGEFGLMTIVVPRGEHYLLLRFEDTTPRISGLWMSVVSVLAIGLWAVWHVLRRKSVKRKT